MSTTTSPSPADIRHRNRVILLALLAAAVISAAAGTLYLRHYGFKPTEQQEEIRYH